MFIQIIDAVLYILIYGSMILFPALFAIHMQVAWENHVDSYYTIAKTNIPITLKVNSKFPSLNKSNNKRVTFASHQA